MWGDHHNDKNINRYGLAEIKLDSDFGIKTSASLSVKAVNDAPELTGDKAKLDQDRKIPYIQSRHLTFYRVGQMSKEIPSQSRTLSSRLGK